MGKAPQTPTALRDTGITAIGDVAWGGHFSIFYETRSDLLDTAALYFRAGLANNEACLWIISEPLTEKAARSALRRRIPDLDRHLSSRNIEILSSDEWYVKRGCIDAKRIIRGWRAKLRTALDRGYEGLRVCGDVAWAGREHWQDICDYEKELHAAISNYRMIALCAYPLSKGRATDILAITQLHKYTVAVRKGEWEIVQTTELKEAKREIKRLNKELERRVIERTKQLVATNEELKAQVAERKHAEEQLHGAQVEIARVAPLTSLGAFAASVAHEINQPLTVAVANTETARRWLAMKPPNFKEARITVKRALADAHRAGRVIKRVRGLLTRVQAEVCGDRYQRRCPRGADTDTQRTGQPPNFGADEAVVEAFTSSRGPGSVAAGPAQSVPECDRGDERQQEAAERLADYDPHE